MYIDDLLSKIDFTGTRGYFSFETFVLNILRFHIESQGKPFSVSSERDGIGDAVAEQGFDEIIGKTIIEIKYEIFRGSDRALKESLIQLSSRCDDDVKNIVYVVGRPIHEKNFLQIANFIKINEFKQKITIFDRTKLNQIVVKNKKKSSEIIENLFALRIESSISLRKKDWLVERAERIESLKELYKQGRFSLFLGAGVSSSAGMPSWNQLLNSLFVKFLTKELGDDNSIAQKDIDEIVERLNEVDSQNALMAARYIRKGFSRENQELHKFNDAISDALYLLRDKKEPINSELIKSIVNLCIPGRQRFAKKHNFAGWLI